MSVQLLLLLAFLPLILASGYILKVWGKLVDRQIRAIRYFIIFELIMQLLATVLFFNKLSNIPFLYVYAPLSLVLLINFYAKLLKEYIGRMAFHIAVAAFVLFTIYDAAFLEGLNSFSSNLLTVRSVILVILAISTMVFLLNKDVRRGKLESISGLHWINQGVLIYHASNLLLFYFGKVIMHQLSPEFSRYTWVLHSFFASIMYVCFFIGLWKSPKQ